MKRFIIAALLIAIFSSSAFAMTQDQAREVLTKYLEGNNSIKTGQIILDENDKPENIEGNKGKFWAFRHAENGEDMIMTINFYYVRDNDGALYVMDILEGDIIPVKELNERERELYSE